MEIITTNKGIMRPDTEIVVPEKKTFVLPGTEPIITPETEAAKRKKNDLDEMLNHVDYEYFGTTYRPTKFALKFIAFIKLVNGSMGEENKSPIIHFDMLDQLIKKRQNLFVSFRGSAKALALDECVRTPDGFKAIGDLHVGDTVFDRNGEQTKIVLESEVFNKEMYRIELDDGRSIKVSADHLNIVNKITTGGKFVEHVITTQDIIDKGIHFNRKVSYHNPKGREGKWYIPLNGAVQYNKSEVGVDPYTTGVILGDGNVGADGYTRIHTCKDDLEELMGLIPYTTGTVREDKRNPNTVRFSIRGQSKAIKKFIGTKNCYSKSVPTELLTGNYSQRLETLQGLMDTDGTTSGVTSSFTTVSPQLAKDVAELARSLGGRANISENNWKSGKSYRVFVLSRFNPFRLKRKADKWLPCKTNKVKHVAITDIVPIPIEPSKCIGVESPTKSFLTKDFIVTKNTTALHEYMILYLAVYGKMPGFGTVNVGMYISDTMDNGVKSMRNQLEFRWDNSDFLKKYIPVTHFTDVRWEFENAEGKKLCFRGFGASTGVRGFKEYGERPTWCGFDDLMSDKNAESATITRDIKNIVYKAARQAMHPKKRMIIWTGTPFNKSDPLYDAAGSRAWNTRTYPICETFPCTKEEFKGAWEDRFPYSFVKNEHESLLESGEISSFNQELMLRITSDEDRLVQDHDLTWYARDRVLTNKSRYNFYITTDFATSDTAKADYSVISVWAYTNNKDWLLVDGFCKRQLMDTNVDRLFRYVSLYKPLSVGIEINGQQGGFIQWLKSEMITRNIFFNLAGKGKTEGIRRTGSKIESFKMFVPTIKAKKMWIPEELKDTELVTEFLEELRFATGDGFKSKHDDVCDTASMLLDMEPFPPSQDAKPEFTDDEDGNHAFYNDYDDEIYNNSTVF